MPRTLLATTICPGPLHHVPPGGAPPSTNSEPRADFGRTFPIESHWAQQTVVTVAVQAFYTAWQRQALQLRWPAGESYSDVRARLLPIVTEMEQQVRAKETTCR